MISSSFVSWSFNTGIKNCSCIIWIHSYLDNVFGRSAYTKSWLRSLVHSTVWWIVVHVLVKHSHTHTHKMTSLHNEVVRASVVKIIVQVLWVDGVAARCGCSCIVIVLPRLSGANKAASATKIEKVFVNTWVIGGLHIVPRVWVIMWGVWDGRVWHVMSTMKWNSWVSFITAAGNEARGRSGGFTVLSGQWWNKWRWRHWLAVVEIKWSGIIWNRKRKEINIKLLYPPTIVFLNLFFF